MNESRRYGRRVTSGAPSLVSADHYAWLREGLAASTPERSYVAQILPAGYERYLRVLDPWTPEGANEPLRRWVDVAADAGAEFYAEISWREIVDVVRQPTAPEDLFSDAHEPTRRRVINALAEATQPAYYFGWDLGATIALIEAPVVVMASSLDPEAAYTAVEPLERRPHPINAGTPEHWWPEDRSWVVSDEYDLEELYIACGSPLADVLLGDGTLEVVEVRPTSRVDWNVDTDRRRH